MFTLRLAYWSASDATESAEYEETTMEGKRRIKEGEKEGYRKPHLHTVRMTPFQLEMSQSQNSFTKSKYGTANVLWANLSSVDCMHFTSRHQINFKG